jgi:hypothetical protein
VTDEQNDVLGGGTLMNRVGNSNGANKARSLLVASFKTDGDEAIALLNQVLTMDIPESPAGDKLLANTYTALATQHTATSTKEAHYLGLALRHTNDPGIRTRIQSQITNLGGDPVAFALNGSTGNATSGRTIGHADMCGSTDNAVITMAGVGDTFSDTGVDIDFSDQDWYTIDVITGDPGAGLLLLIETCSDDPGGFTDDTDIFLYDACGGTQIGFGGDGGCNAPFMSEIATGCLGEGTYYLDVEGWLFSAGNALNIDVNVSATAACVVPQPDSFEPDDAKADAGSIGHDKPYNNPDAATGGHIASDIQAHSIFPAGDIDLMSFRLRESAIVEFETANCFPTIFNGFDPACNNGTDQPDTIMSIAYPFNNGLGGLCNQQTYQDSFTIIGPPCQDDLGCDLDGDGLVFPDDDDLIFPIAGFPACLPWSLFGLPEREGDNPLAINDDKAAGVWSSALTLCLPRTTHNSPDSSVEGAQPDFSWYVRVVPWGATDSFDYEVFVHNKERCNFESEPNDGFATSDSAKSKRWNESNHITIGETISGIYDFRRDLAADLDLFDFDVTEESAIFFATDGYDSNAVDTYIELFVGPDDNGDFFTTGLWGEDNGPGWLSELAVILPPSCDLLGVDCREETNGKGKYAKGKGPLDKGPSYWMLVTSNYFNPNFPYDLHSEFIEVGLQEADFGDFGPDCDSGTEAAAALGDSWVGLLDGSCDYDAYKVSLATNTDINFYTAGIDTTMQLVNCDTGEVLGCDDDSAGAFASQITGCLAGPADYCVRIRGWGSTSGAYGLELEGTEGCTVSGPLTSDYGFACADFPSSTGFDTCP